MIEFLGLQSLEEPDAPVLVQDEPALEIAMPRVFTQAELKTLVRGKFGHLEGAVARILRTAQHGTSSGLGTEYQALVNEFQPLFTWIIASWDFLLSTEGCRFVLRRGEQKIGARGDYRVFTSTDFSRLAHGLFRQCIVEFAQHPEVPSLTQWVRERFWPSLVDAYRRLELPPDPQQRRLTPYSYLRCVPYEFMNPFHETLVRTTLTRLPETERLAIDAYFLQFRTEDATAATLHCPLEACVTLLRQGLTTLLIHDRLVYCLLRQIERY